MLGKTRSQERGVRSDKQHHESEGESRHARLRAPTSWEKVAIGGNTRSDANKGQRIEARLLQLRVFRLGSLQDGDVGGCVFPEREEIVIGDECPDAALKVPSGVPLFRTFHGGGYAHNCDGDHMRSEGYMRFSL